MPFQDSAKYVDMLAPITLAAAPSPSQVTWCTCCAALGRPGRPQVAAGSSWHSGTAAQHLSLAMHVEADSMIKRESLTARHLHAETYG